MLKEQSKPPSPTDFLANERTFLAWIRTGIAILAFGFVVVKFSLFINQIATISSVEIVLPNATYAYWTGLALVVLGTVMTILAFVRYRQVEKQLKNHQYQSTTSLSLLLTVCIVFVGILLLIYLA